MSASINISELAAELLAAPTNPRLRLVAASHGPWLLAAADALRGSADQRAAAARLGALLLPLHHQLQPVLLEPAARRRSCSARTPRCRPSSCCRSSRRRRRRPAASACRRRRGCCAAPSCCRC